MGTMASQITSLTIVYSIVYSDADERKHQSSASLAFVQGIHRGPVNSPHKWPVTRKMFPFYDVIMMMTCHGKTLHISGPLRGKFTNHWWFPSQGPVMQKQLGPFFFQNVILFSNVVHHKCNIFYMKLVQYNECLISIVDTDGLVLYHQGISNHSADCSPMHFPVFRAKCTAAICITS